MSFTIAIALVLLLGWFWWEKVEQALFFHKVKEVLMKHGFSSQLAEKWLNGHYYNVLYGWSRAWSGERIYREFSD